VARVNGKIRAREVRVIGLDGKQLGILSLGDAITLARNHGVDLVEIAATATPPVCRLVDYGKFRYEQSKKDKEARKRQHANKVKEVQLGVNIDARDFEVKLGHAIDFLCEEMKVKITLRFRGREMAHPELGMQVVDKFINALTAYGHPDSEPKLVGRGLNVMLSPLPRNKRAKNPRVPAEGDAPGAVKAPEISQAPVAEVLQRKLARSEEAPSPSPPPISGFANNPFSQLDIKAAR
jgi:translation initiation factor IF-3